MTVNEKLKELASTGAGIKAAGFDVGTLAAAMTRKGRFGWVKIFPEDQHHVHSIPYSKVEIIYNRDVAVYDADGELIAYVAPLNGNIP